MLKIPDEIEDVVRRCERGERPKHTVRKLLQWFGVSRRGASSTAQIALALQAQALVTDPDFSDAWIDEELTFSLSGQRAPTLVEPVEPEVPSIERTNPALAPSSTEPAVIEGAVGPSNEPAALAPPESTLPTAMPAQVVANERDGGFRFGSLDLRSRHKRSFVLRTDSLAVAISRMQLDNAAVMLVSNNGLRGVTGVLTWPMIVRALQERPAEQWTAGACHEAFGRPLESVRCSIDEELLEVARRVQRDGYVVVRERNNECFVVTLAELGAEFGQRLEPFLLATEIEASLRAIVQARLANEARALFRSREVPLDDEREAGVRVTIGEALYLLSNDANWAKARINHDRRAFIELLDGARRARNDVVHVNPEGVPEEHIETLRRCVEALRDVIKRLR
ncbi:MAG: hypothetical protein U0269_19735 [Polyangiales bacterium]